MSYFKTPKGTELPFLVLKGKNYLQVAHRLIWFLEEKPNWVITSRIVERTDQFIIMEATILDESGKVRASAHKSMPWAQMNLEKSETGAIGRALAFLGYGTQFAEDLFDDEDSLADAPIAKPEPKAAPKQAPPTNKSLSEPQVKRLWAIAHKSRYSNADVFELLRRYKVSDPANLSKPDYDSVCAYMEKIPKTEAAQVGIN